MLKIRIVKAALKKSTSMFTTMSPHVSIKIDGKEYESTKPNSGGKTPEWNHDLKDIEVTDPKIIMQLTVYNGKTSLGMALIKLSSLMLNKGS